MATAKKTEVAIAASTAIATSDVPDYIKQGTNRGSEEVTSSDMVLPRLEIVQSQSPIKEVLEEAREGMLFNSVTQQLVGDIAYFVPIYFRVEHLVWKDSDEGGGFFGSFPTNEQAMERKAEVVSEGENPDFIEIVDTPVHYGLLVDPDQPGKMEQIVVSMAKSKSKVSRKWNAMIQIVGGDRFSRCYKITTYTDENKKGQKFKNFVVAPAGFAPEFAYKEAERLYESFRAGVITADHASAAGVGEGVATERGEL